MLFLSVFVIHNAFTAITTRNATISQIIAHARKKHRLTFRRPSFLTESRPEREEQAKTKMKDVEKNTEVPAGTGGISGDERERITEQVNGIRAGKLVFGPIFR
jgi:hypothetical protein